MHPGSRLPRTDLSWLLGGEPTHSFTNSFIRHLASLPLDGLDNMLREQTGMPRLGLFPSALAEPRS